MIATTIEQSQRLLAAGIDPKTADMCWTDLVDSVDSGGYFINEREDVFHLEVGFSRQNEDIIPAWSLSALILLLPEHIFYRLARTRGHNIERLFEDCVNYLCKK